MGEAVVLCRPQGSAAAIESPRVFPSCSTLTPRSFCLWSRSRRLRSGTAAATLRRRLRISTWTRSDTHLRGTRRRLALAVADRIGDDPTCAAGPEPNQLFARGSSAPAGWDAGTPGPPRRRAGSSWPSPTRTSRVRVALADDVRAVASLGELGSRPSLDVVHVCTPVESHADVVAGGRRRRCARHRGEAARRRRGSDPPAARRDG